MIAQPDAPLAQREPEYRAIFEASSDGLVINDAETSLVLEANPACCQMHGYDRMTGLHPTTFIHADSYHLFAEYVQAIQAGKEYRARAHDLHRDGTFRSGGSEADRPARGTWPERSLPASET